jgi:RNA polymerase sigma-70 factor (ECF subfamily)
MASHLSDSTDPHADWEDVYSGNVAWVYRFLYRHVGNPTDAEDLTSEVFLAALRPLRVTASRAEVRAYLVRTARTVLVHHWRRQANIDIAPLDDNTIVPDWDDAIDPRVARHAHAVLATLPERYRSILELRFLQGMSVTDTAHTMGISVTNAKVLQHRALRAALRRDNNVMTADAVASDCRRVA